MTEEDIKRMAKEAGFEGCAELTWEGVICTDELLAFAKLVAQHEREACAKEALAQPEQEPVACVYKATTKKGEAAHFGEYSAAKAWAGWGTVEQVPLKTLTLISKSIKPCPTCEALARTVMLDQTSHDTAPLAGDIRALKHRIHELEGELLGYKKIVADQDALLERQTARIVDLQTHIDNFDGEDR